MTYKTFMGKLLLAALPAFVAGCSPAPTVDEATAINEVFGDGSKMTAVIISCSDDIDGSRLTTDCFEAVGREISDIYTSATPDKGTAAPQGRHIVLELAAKTELRPVMPQETKGKMQGPVVGGGGHGPGFTPHPEPTFIDTVLVSQVKPVYSASGKEIAPTGVALTAITSRTLLADDFKQFTFHDSQTGIDLRYNLYTPAVTEEKVPLLLFMHDASGAGKENHRYTLLQGNGATVWVSPEWQAEHPCYVLAPQFGTVTVDDDFHTTPDLDACLNLLDSIIANANVDPDKVYTTGQSMGCMMSYEFMARRPELFASAMLVAGQWDAKKLAPLAKKPLWILSCKGDLKSSDGVAKAIKVWERAGAKVVEQEWPLEASPDERDLQVKGMLEEGGNIHFTHFAGGSHNNTWCIAYSIQGVKEWLFKQTR